MEELFQPVKRTSLSHEARRQILECIADGRLAPQSRISELDLARRLGVSRTPLHEAMVSLARDGLVQNLGRRGWLVAPISEADAKEIYPIAGALSSLALSLQDSSVLASLDDLKDLAARLAGPGLSAADKIAMEVHWHETLLAGCGNRTLVEALRVLHVRAFRVEMACVREGWPRPVGEPSGVAQCLERGEPRGACRSLEMHWRDRGQAIVHWLGQVRPTLSPTRVA